MSRAEFEWVRSGSRNEYIQKTFGCSTLLTAAFQMAFCTPMPLEPYPVQKPIIESGLANERCMSHWLPPS